MQQHILTELPRHAIFFTDLPVFRRFDVVGLHVGKVLLHRQPVFRKRRAAGVGAVNFSAQGFPEFVQSLVCFGRKAKKIADLRVFFLQSLAVDLEGRVFVNFVQHHQHGRAATETGGVFEPFFGLVVVAAVEQQHIDAALREKKLVGGVHHFLPAEVPEVGGDAVAVVHGERRLANADAVRLAFLAVEVLAEQPFYERGFARRGFAEKYDFDFV